jgi:hypothetical protein
MTDPINLNKARKARARAADKAQAVENRIRFGRTGAERSVSKLEAERARRSHEGAKREDD